MRPELGVSQFSTGLEQSPIASDDTEPLLIVTGFVEAFPCG